MLSAPLVFCLCVVVAATPPPPPASDGDGEGCDGRAGPVHGKAVVVLRRPSAVILRYSCGPRYLLQGPRYTICVRGRWTTPLPTCVLHTRHGHSGPELVNDGAATEQGQGVLISMEELPPTERTSRRMAKSRKIKRKKKRKRKGKDKQMDLMRKPGLSSREIGFEEKGWCLSDCKQRATDHTNGTILLKFGNDGINSPALDMSCLVNGSSGNRTFLRPPQVPNSLGPKFLRRKGEKVKYVMAVYRCAPGYKLHSPRSRSLGCRRGKWVGRLPICLPRPKKTGCFNAGCEHDCKMINGKPKCFCFKGFRQHGKSCKDINECSSENGGCVRACHNTPGSFHCSCPPGYRLAANQASCIDVNECLVRNGHGPCQGQCHNIVGGYQCSCEDTPGTRLAVDGISCRDIDECSETDHLLGCSHGCINTLGSAFCLCPAHLQLGPDWKTCVDTEGCEANSSNCPHICLVVPGTADCVCPPGFKRNADDNTCQDVNECSEYIDSPRCSHTCENTVGSYHCSCLPGHHLSTNTRTCQPEEDECQRKNCSQECKIHNDKAICFCKEGYILVNELSCVNINECDQESSGCSHLCVNVEGSFTCTCPEGISLLPDEKSCFMEESTTDYDDSTAVICLEGFEYVNSSCQDANECLDDKNLCSHICKNTDGSYKCFCRDGFYLSEDKTTCLDIDECDQGGICSPGQCINTEGSYYCKCLVGYTMDSRTGICEDIDECSFTVDEGYRICSHICVNSQGSYHCECPNGYLLGKDSRTCKDIDECIENNEINKRCSHSCINLDGGYRCDCPQGYALQDDHHVCSEVNGCDIDNGGCSHICFIEGDEIICECPSGMILSDDGVTCLSTPCSDTSECSHGCNEIDGNCFCPEGFILHENNKDCVDLNECLNNNGNCSEDCVNTLGSYLCTCTQGYQLDPVSQTCIDINECTGNISLCDQVCINSNGSYKCDCFNGFIWSPDKETCLDIDECLLDNKCEDICVNTEGSFECRCRDGFSLSSGQQSCVDVDECTLNISDCSQICNNQEGGYSCACNKGFKLINETVCIEDSTFVAVYDVCEDGYRDERGACCCGDGYVLFNNTVCVHIETCNDHSNCDFNNTTPYNCITEGPAFNNEGVSYNDIECRRLDFNLSTGRIDCGAQLEHYPIGTECFIRCNIGYNLVGPEATTCLDNGSWSDGHAFCQAQIRPYIRCPLSQRHQLPAGLSSMTVAIPRPRSNVDWDKYVAADPPWGKSPQAKLPYGVTTVQYSAASPTSSHVARCNLTFHVKDTEKPTLSGCPGAMEMVLGPGQLSMPVSWVEPAVMDNVRVAHLYQSQRPGVKLTSGTHVITYIAADSSGNIATCQFTVTVTGSNQPDQT